MSQSRLVSRIFTLGKKMFGKREVRLENELIRLTRKDVAQRLIALERGKIPRLPERTVFRAPCRDWSGTEHELKKIMEHAW